MTDPPPRKKENKLVSATDGGLFVLHHGGYFSENIYRMAPFPLRDQSLQNRHTNLWSYQREKNTGSSLPPPLHTNIGYNARFADTHTEQMNSNDSLKGGGRVEKQTF